jgi:8-oxo-dGTP diphosphatase
MAKHQRTVQHDFYVYVDAVVLTVTDGRLQVLVVKRATAQDGRFAIPGGLVEEGEDLAEAASRELQEETGIVVSPKHLRQIGAYGHPDRDTRYGRAITVAFLALVPTPEVPNAGSDAVKTQFIDYKVARKSGVMEFDHRDIVGDARRLARSQLEDTSIALDFCHKEFTMSELRSVYEAFYQRELDPANFRRKVEAIDGFVEPQEFVTSSESAGRPARLYKKGTAQDLYPPIWFRRQEK